MMPDDLDLVLWGHEHACGIAGGFFEEFDDPYTVIQPGSTVHVRGPGGRLGSGRGSGQ